jgi:hypothetical protein
MRRLIQFCLDDPAFTGATLGVALIYAWPVVGAALASAAFAVRVLQLTWRAWHWWRAGSR